MDLALWGKLGRLGEPIVRRRSVEVEQQFSAAFADAVLGRTPAPAPVPTRPQSSAKPASAPAVSGSGPAAGDDPRFWRTIVADILEHLARKLR
jgi:hypothetical protein